MWEDELDELIELKQRIETMESADPDPYGYHGLDPELRMEYMMHYLRTGNYAI